MAVPLVCHGHSRPVVDLCYSPVTPDGFFLISASKGICQLHFPNLTHVYMTCNRMYVFLFSTLMGYCIYNLMPE